MFAPTFAVPIAYIDNHFCQNHEASKTGNSRTGDNCYQYHTVDPGDIPSRRYDTWIGCKHYVICYSYRRSSTIRNCIVSLKENLGLSRLIIKELGSYRKFCVGSVSLKVANALVTREQDVFVGDLEFDGVDALSISEFKDGVWDIARVTGAKSYYKDGKKLETSTPLSVVNYIDKNFDYIEMDKQFRELIADVSKPLEYKDDKKKGDSNKKKSRWGKKTRHSEEKGPKTIDMGVPTPDPNAPPPVLTPPPIGSTPASELHAAALTQMATGTPTLAASKIVKHSQVSGVGIESPVPQGDWNAPEKIKLYVVPIGVYVEGQYEVGVMTLFSLDNGGLSR